MEIFNPFALPDDLWTLPKSDLLDEPPQESLFQRDLLKLLQIDDPFKSGVSSKTESLFSGAPWGEPLPPLSFSDHRVSPKSLESVEGSDKDSGIGVGEDPWLDIFSLSSEEISKGDLISWETFLTQGSFKQTNPFATEAGPHVIDAVLQRHYDNGSAPAEPPKNIVQTDVLIYCLLHLVQGRDSLLFKFNSEKRIFEPKRQDLRISGATVGATERVISKFRKCGNELKALQAFTNEIYSESSHPCKTRVALAHCVRIVTVAVRYRLTVSFASIKSLLQLEDTIKVPALILDVLLNIVTKVKKYDVDHQLLSVIFDQIQQSEYRSDWLRRLLLLMLQRVAFPWLSAVSKAIGVISDKGPFEESIFDEDEDFFIGMTEIPPQDGEDEPYIDLFFVPGNIPSFLIPEEAERIYETARGLRLLKRFHPEHPLLSDRVIEKQAISWRFSWEEIQAIDLEASAHEKRQKLAIQTFNFIKRERFSRVILLLAPRQRDEYQFDCFGKNENEIQAGLAASVETMNIEPKRQFGFEGAIDDGLGIETLAVNQLTPIKSSSRYQPPLSITFSLSVNPILHAQARLTNMACMRLLFKEKNIRTQFELLHSFLLFGDGVYVTRLSTALFSEELASGSTNTGIRTGIATGGWGLQLGVRNDWPPASSELRLALMGIMSDCYAAGIGRFTGHKENDDLPGGLSFSVREMSPEEEEDCKNPDSLEALDFLQVRYRPESPFDAIIDTSSLVKYDRLFKHLIRIVRMLFVVNRLFAYTNIDRGKTRVINPTIQRFRVEAHFFVSTLAKYIFETGVETVWKEFQQKIDEVERRLERYEISDRNGEIESLGQLAAYHNSCLDQMLFATMLRLRQQPVLKLVEEIFSMILRFGKMVRLQHAGVVDPLFPTDNATIGRLYAKFRKRVGIFINVARALSERRGYGGLAKRESDKSRDGMKGSADTAEGGTLGQLLVKLEMSSYYVDMAKIS